MGHSHILLAGTSQLGFPLSLLILGVLEAVLLVGFVVIGEVFTVCLRLAIGDRGYLLFVY